MSVERPHVSHYGCVVLTPDEMRTLAAAKRRNNTKAPWKDDDPVCVASYQPDDYNPNPCVDLTVDGRSFDAWCRWSEIPAALQARISADASS